MSGDGWQYPTLPPWGNAYLHRADPAERVQTCAACGEDFDDVTPCECYPSNRRSA